MQMNKLARLGLMLCCFFWQSCGDQEPGTNGDTGGDSDGDGDGDGGGDGDTGDYYPMAVGNYWVYEEESLSGDTATLRYEVTGKETVTLDHGVGDRELFVLHNTFPGETGEERTQYIEDDGVRAVRHRHLIYTEADGLTKQRDFVPGFLRFDRSKISVGDKWVEELVRYTDTKDDTPVTEQTVRYQYEVISLKTSVTVPLGTFECLELKRFEMTGSELKIYYFARNIGKVKEITGDKEERLVEYNVN